MTKIMMRDQESNTVQVGTVIWDGKKVVFDLPDFWIKRLQQIKVEGKTYKPTSKEYVDMLPRYLWGDRVWATT